MPTCLRGCVLREPPASKLSFVSPSRFFSLFPSLSFFPFSPLLTPREWSNVTERPKRSRPRHRSLASSRRRRCFDELPEKVTSFAFVYDRNELGPPSNRPNTGRNKTHTIETGKNRGRFGYTLFEELFFVFFSFFFFSFSFFLSLLLLGIRKYIKSVRPLLFSRLAR